MKAFLQLSEVAFFSDLPPAASLVPKLLELLMAWHPYAFLSRPGCDTGPGTGSLAIFSVVYKLSLQTFLDDDAMELLLTHAFDCEPLSLTVTRLYEIGRMFPERQRQILRTVTARPLEKLQPKLVLLLFRVVQDWGANEDPAVFSRVQALVEDAGDVEESDEADADKLLQGQDIFFVDGISGVAALEATVVEVEEALAAGLIVRVGVDAEWRDPRPLSLLQIAVQVDGGLVSVFLIDMIGHSDEVRRCCRRLLLNSRDENHIVLGFSPSEDLRRLRIARVFNAGEEYEPPSQLLVDGLPAGFANWMDLQCQEWSGFSGRMGLTSVVELALGLDLDKSLQVSDWDRRPLTRAQMAYAALDASILLRLHAVLGAAALEGTAAPSSASSASTPDSAAEDVQKDDKEQEAPLAGDVSERRRRWRANVPDSSKVLARERHAGLRFLIPKPLSRLLRHLRGLGLDAVFFEDGTTRSALADMALEQDRQIVLPSYKRPLPKAAEDRVIVLESRSPKKQVQEIVSAFGVQLTADCFCGRCGECNAWDWRLATREEARAMPGAPLVEVLESYEEFWICENCDKVYWQGTIFDAAMQKFCDLIGSRDGGSDSAVPVPAEHSARAKMVREGLLTPGSLWASRIAAVANDDPATASAAKGRPSVSATERSALPRQRPPPRRACRAGGVGALLVGACRRLLSSHHMLSPQPGERSASRTGIGCQVSRQLALPHAPRAEGRAALLGGATLQLPRLL
mmetsp:Transcript_38266/g.123087  ORF Transcript_38266/g.123087 Transcript_38266/m.123087 type:complete len:742 (+) Transcript_38266:2-2227(+)